MKVMEPTSGVLAQPAHDLNRKLCALGRLVGNTPLLGVHFQFRGRQRIIYAKCEQFNMTGSIKDRMALHILKKAYASGIFTRATLLASPSMGVSTRDMTDDLAGIDSEALDISFLVTFAEKLPDTDSSRIAVGASVGEGYRAYLRRRGTLSFRSWLKWMAASAITQDLWQKLDPFTRSN